MKYIYEDFVNDDEIASAEAQGYTINVRFCRDCPNFIPNGVQFYDDVKYGRCSRLSFESDDPKWTSHYIRVTTNSFCNDDYASREGEGIEIL